MSGGGLSGKDGGVLVAMSGGVDSSVAALLLMRQGFRVAGATMKLLTDPLSKITEKVAAASDHAAGDAARVAEGMGISFQALDFGESFRKEVLEPFGEAYVRGLTPNPCVLCNPRLKFGKLLEHARSMGLKYIATGHYAKVGFDEDTGRYYLKKAADERKDQTYMLYGLSQDQLASILFPLGDLTKETVREIAREAGLETAEKKDSQDICFVEDGGYAAFVERLTGQGSLPGSFVDAHGRVLGEHKGLVHYTVGQRKGLGISFPEPLYVKELRPRTNEVVLGRDSELFSDSLRLRDMNWMAEPSEGEEISCEVKIRYAHRAAPAVFTRSGEETGRVVFKDAQRAITPGQAAVIYRGDRVIAGGTIVKEEEEA